MNNAIKLGIVALIALVVGFGIGQYGPDSTKNGAVSTAEPSVILSGVMRKAAAKLIAESCVRVVKLPAGSDPSSLSIA